MPSMHSLGPPSRPVRREPPKIPQMASRASSIWIALIAYSIVAVAVFSSTWIDPAGSWIGSPQDPGLFVWFLRWVPPPAAPPHHPPFPPPLPSPPPLSPLLHP